MESRAGRTRKEGSPLLGNEFGAPYIVAICMSSQDKEKPLAPAGVGVALRPLADMCIGKDQRKNQSQYSEIRRLNPSLLCI
jgi:hypothetical protein